jgi:hypothetical protein
LQQLQVYKQVKHNSKHSISAAANSQVSKVYKQVKQQQTFNISSRQFTGVPLVSLCSTCQREKV